MASRRDELNAYTFAKKRLVAAFLQPSPTGSEEGAPRPLRGILPGIVVGALILAGFGAWGMFKPKAPEGWDTPKEKVIIGSESTTRYVVLETNGKAQLHPVLNLASAKLLLDPGKGEVVKVDEKVLDKGDIPHGATLGIPYAPDRLPEAGEAGEKKRWAVCERPSQGDRAVQKAAFVLADRDKDKVEGKNRLRGGELAFVQGPDDRLYVVDKSGRKYRIAQDRTLLTILVGDRKPQRVSREWLATLHTGHHISFPQVPGRVGSDAGISGLDPNTNQVGTVIKSVSGNHMQHYVVLSGKVLRITDFMAQLLLASKQLLPLNQDGEAIKVNPSAFSASGSFGYSLKWPRERSYAVNSASTRSGSRNVVCNVLRNVSGKNGATTLSTWVGKEFPEQLPAGTSSAYVTPGTGQLVRQFKGRSPRDGGVFLVTDTGLRYAMQNNTDSEQGDSGIGEDGKKSKKKPQEQSESQNAQRRLGYEKVKPAPIPAEWAAFLPTGPRLSTGDAQQPQGS